MCIFKDVERNNDDKRIVLFRGKDVDNDCWRYGYYADWNGIATIMALKHDFMYIVDPETVCEFTNCYDGYGEKIFENDIVTDYDGSLYIIKYNLDASGFFAATLPFNDESELYCIDDTVYQLIGNAFDNKDYLECDSRKNLPEY